MKEIDIEVCAYSLESCEAARACGATRVELCASPYEGGTTPSAAAIRLARQIPGLQLSVMIRPRGGDFLYSEIEFTQMLEEILFARECGAEGVVFGVLTADGRVDVERTAKLVTAANPMQVTFHRAFDLVCDRHEALEAVIAAGCHRILTSGGCNTAIEGIDELRRIVLQAANRIEIMAGSGVNPQNARMLAMTHVDALHFSARKMRESAMQYRNSVVSMGSCSGISEYEIAYADPQIIREIVSKLRS